MLKAFSSGFFLSTTLAVAWETVVGMAMRILVDIFLALSGTDVAVDGGYSAIGPERMENLVEKLMS